MFLPFLEGRGLALLASNGLGGLLLVLLFAVPAAAQGFNTFSGRNHPELDWQVAETEHFEIMYPAHLQGIEAEAAPIAEASYEALSKNLDVTFDEKIRIYLSDEDEIANGFAVPVGAGYTNIWVHNNDFATVWTGQEKWLRKVIAHELAHIFHYQATRSDLGLLGRFFADPTPSFWTEGLAQYETEVWDAQRGDRWLRTAVLDDELSYSDGRSAWNGRLLYAVGNAQVRYFAEQYGDTTLAKFLKHRRNVLLGLAEVHDVDAAFEATIDKSYRAFYDDWRRHVNIYYNTLAGQLEPTDSLEGPPLTLAGQYLYDVQVNPADTARLAVLTLTSVERPVRRLYVLNRKDDDLEVVAEGSIRAPVAWSPDGRRLAFARLTRGRYGSLVNDLFLVDADGGNLRRLTSSRRASSPTFAPDGQRLVFVGNDGGTANLFLLDLQTGAEVQLTRFTGDVQILDARWHPTQDQIAFSRFTPGGTRDIALLDVSTGAVRPITSGAHDDRLPVWSPDGQQLAFTSLRDRVPNVFVLDLAAGSTRRLTNLATGAEAFDWQPPDSVYAEGHLIVGSGVSKRRDRAYRVPPTRPAPSTTPEAPRKYTQWTAHRPPHTIPSTVPPDPSLITARYPYRSWRNITHTVSLAVPYYNDPEDWGLIGFTTWLEPLGKHLFTAFGGLSFASPRDESFLYATYANNQWYPTVALSGYLAPGSARVYGDELLVESYAGGDVTVAWPLDWFVQPFASTWFSTRLRLIDVEPLNLDELELSDDFLPQPEGGQQADLRLALTWRKQRPYRYNVVHPLDGLGLRFQATGAARLLGTDTRFLRGDAAAFGIFQGLFGFQRLYLYGRAQAQTGRPLPQNFLGLSRYDEIQLDLPGFIPLTLGDDERVRGYQAYAIGNRVLFGSAEYRVPLTESLQTEILGLVSFGATALALFADGALVWTDASYDDAIQRLGVGAEIKNALRIGGFRITHALGFAQPADVFGTDDAYEIYYRIRTPVPF